MFECVRGVASKMCLSLGCVLFDLIMEECYLHFGAQQKGCVSKLNLLCSHDHALRQCSECIRCASRMDALSSTSAVLQTLQTLLC